MHELRHALNAAGSGNLTAQDANTRCQEEEEEEERLADGGGSRQAEQRARELSRKDGGGAGKHGGQAGRQLDWAASCERSRSPSGHVRRGGMYGFEVGDGVRGKGKVRDESADEQEPTGKNGEDVGGGGAWRGRVIPSPGDESRFTDWSPHERVVASRGDSATKMDGKNEEPSRARSQQSVPGVQGRDAQGVFDEDGEDDGMPPRPDALEATSSKRGGSFAVQDLKPRKKRATCKAFCVAAA